jgi:hypothetical protein
VLLLRCGCGAGDKVRTIDLWQPCCYLDPPLTPACFLAGATASAAAAASTAPAFTVANPACAPLPLQRAAGRSQSGRLPVG